jgi:hypothetical protein
VLAANVMCLLYGPVTGLALTQTGSRSCLQWNYSMDLNQKYKVPDSIQSRNIK